MDEFRNGELINNRIYKQTNLRIQELYIQANYE